MKLSDTGPDARPCAPEVAATLRDEVLSSHAYAVPPATGLIKLDAMENPFPLPAALQDALGQRLAHLAVNRYPDPAHQASLRAALRQHEGLADGLDVMLGNGSDELIALLSQAVRGPDGSPGTVLAPEPGFVMYGVSARLNRQNYVGVPLKADDFGLDAPAMVTAIREHRPALVYLAYPNNPTANLFDDEAVAQVVDAVLANGHGFVVFDEAYQPFASKSQRARLGQSPQILVMRTLSKFGLAGVRLGYLMGPTEVIAQLDKVRPPYNISVLNLECALFALEHASEFARQARLIRDQREQLCGLLGALPGVRCWPSQANMILLRVGDSDAQATAVHASLRAQGVLVKNISAAHPLLRGCLRLTVGSPEENIALVRSLHQALDDSRQPG
ncbi:pyridoxal phosphate-dependent aminotransferase [Amphibiibacter pelophylacis]|uniref:Aminotransferase class I/II-fold pyridoxal phosphate-dependent enzyme n=1 Tax=Amphibiibacter pelophylacis TaxID=1799477 RepID=A0ACC6P2Y7_9BURK